MGVVLIKWAWPKILVLQPHHSRSAPAVLSVNPHADHTASYVRERDYRDRALDEQDLKWLFPKIKNKVGIYRDFATLPQDQRLVSLQL